ncbi:MAG: pantoate--beta-alanine ligase [Maricaulis sp.]|uniref:Pantothenate synthetase n=1 Tax=Maricaulis virginensis TaxID=144022 RepID=A0A9W6MMA0_9PROT|nr:pantoate--beta-alanine ligase [Maricaulis virginensis]MAC39794.1 pantoate--beta-alanine ligase [Oceanicaulis sp.]MAZ90856.1 pantoate--beta-alanine ligase [Maricaulis sp.]GLK50982.1 pantothenate synthetase [Maricaulis virginensis]|tara:strand:+ start:89 stop:955 length:867 start_codon:yes stop_codon:yes gene_type:complete
MLNLQIPHATTVSALRARIRSWRDDRLSIGFVPTMGALHDGHISLVRLAKAHCDRVVASVFVNPRQFAEGEDLDAYPRTMLEDSEKLTLARCDLIFLPDVAEMYPEGYSANISMQGAAVGLESVARPHFFDGVATVVAKLFNQVRPDMAFFGEKDYQQLLVIRQMVRDLNFGIDIIGGETMRERDGLAMSSRNVYLSADDRVRAARLNVILKEFAAALNAGMPADQAQKAAMASAAAAFDAVDYVEARCAATLEELPSGPIDRDARVLAAVRLGSTRLIDNMAAKRPS